ncbi:MAG: GWxTD domain-containing protein [Gemmatimonadota bacterium]
MKGSRSKGHPSGGPWFFGLILASVVAAAACAGPAGPRGPTPVDDDAVIARPLDVYEQLGMLTGTPDYPAVASMSMMAGPADSTYVVLALSLPTSALRFQRDEDGFVSRYSVAATFSRDGEVAREVSRQSVVRVWDFEETSRSDESVIFQELVSLAPGEYTFRVLTRDENSTRGAVFEDSLEVPSFTGEGAVRYSDPLFVYRAAPRMAVADRPDVIVNPRRTVFYGADPPRLYVEGYGAAADEASPVRIRIRDDSGEDQWSTEVRLNGGGGEVRNAVVDIPADALPLGRLTVELLAPDDTTAVSRAPLVVTISDQWLVANFDEMLDFLRYIATPEEIDSLESATGAERQERWRRFWERRDPVPATPANEFRDQFFDRIRTATIQFGESGTPGWATDRGRVYIVLGPPDGVFEQRSRRGGNFGRPERMLWLYENAAGSRVTLTFEDRNGFGRYELTPSSESQFRALAQRIRQQHLRTARPRQQ